MTNPDFRLNYKGMMKEVKLSHQGDKVMEDCKSLISLPGSYIIHLIAGQQSDIVILDQESSAQALRLCAI